MTQVDSVKSFEGKQKLSAYDLKRVEKAAIYSLAGDARAKDVVDEFVNDKKFDKVRNAVISIGAIAAAVATGKGLVTKILSNEKIGKYAKNVIKTIIKGADSVVDLIKGTEGGKYFTNLLKKDIAISPKLKKFANKVINKFVKDPEYKVELKTSLKNAAEWLSKKTGIKKYSDLAVAGASVGVGTIVDEPLKKIANDADDGNRMNEKIAKGEEV